MPAARAGTAYIKVDADFSEFNRQVNAKIHERLSQDIHIKADASSLRTAEGHVKSFTSHTDKANFSVDKLGGGLRKLYKEAAMITAVGLGSQAISALGAAATAAASSLAPLSGALAAYPAVASAGAQAAGTWKLAFNGVKEAVGGINEQLDTNSKKFKELTPEGQKFAKTLDGMKGPLRELSQTAQKGLLPGLTEGIQSAMKNFPILQKGVGDTAKTIGDLATEAGRLVGSKGFGRDLETQMGRNNVTIKRLGESGLYLASAMRHIVISAGPLVDWMTKTTLAVSKNVDQWAKAGRESGKFNSFFIETRHVMTDVGHIAVNLGAGLINIFKGAYPVGRDFLDVSVKLSEKFKEWTGSVEGQNKIRKFFEDAKPAMSEAGKLVGALAIDFGKLGTGHQVAPLLRTLRVDLLPRLYDMVDSTTKAFGPAFISALGQVVTLFTNLGGTSGPLVLSARIIGATAGVINKLMDAVPPLKTAIVTILAVGAIEKALHISAAITGIQRLTGLMQKIPGVRLPAIGGVGGNALTARSAGLVEVSDLKPVPVYIVGNRLTGGTGFNNIGRPSTPAEWERSGRSISQNPFAQRGAALGDPAAIRAMERAAQEEAERVGGSYVSRLKTSLKPVKPTMTNAMKGIGIGIGGLMATDIAASLVHGPAQGWVSAIGTGSSIGAGIGEAFGPGGAVVGALAGGLVAGIGKFVSDNAPDESKKFADALTQGMPDAVQASINQALRRRYHIMVETTPPHTGTPQHPTIVPQGTAPGLPRMPPTPGLNQPSSDTSRDRAERNRLWNQWFNSQYTFGFTSGQNYWKGYNAVRYKTPESFTAWSRDLAKQMKGQSTVARQAAAQSTLMYAQSLIQHGKLPKSAMATVLAGVKREYPDLDRYFKTHSLDTAQHVADAFKFKQARANTHNTIKDIKNQWGLGKLGVTGAWKDTSSDVQKEADFLKKQMHSSNKSIRDEATKDFRALQRSVTSEMKTAATTVSDKMGIIHNKIVSGSASAASQATGSFGSFASNIQAALRSGVLNAGEAAKLIGKALNAMLVAFGQDRIPLAGMSAKELVQWEDHWQKGGTGKTSDRGVGYGATAARGALIQIGQPGQAGYDSVPMNVGGTDIVVAPGEVAAVFTRHQAAELNYRLAPEGGLRGWFDKRKKPNYMAGGGLVTASWFDDPKTASGRVHVPGYAELSNPPGSLNFSALGHLPFGTVLSVTGGGTTIKIPKVDVGAGGPALPPATVRAIDLTREAAVMIPGLIAQGLMNVMISGPLGIDFGAGGGAAFDAMPDLKITGGGTMGRIVQAFANRVTDAANKYGQAHMPATAVTGPAGTLGAQGPQGLGAFDGYQVSNWIIPILNWARSHGWPGHITSGYRPGSITSSGHPSNHGAINYPGGAVDVGDKWAMAQGQALWNVIKNYPGSPKLLSAAWGPGAWGPYEGAPHDYGHFSATGHARGGIIQHLANGGDVYGFTLPPGTTTYRKPPPWSTRVMRQLNNTLGGLRRHPHTKSTAKSIKKLIGMIKAPDADLNKHLSKVSDIMAAVTTDATLAENAGALITDDKTKEIAKAILDDKSWQTPEMQKTYSDWFTHPDTAVWPKVIRDIQMGIIKKHLPKLQGKDQLDWLNQQLSDLAWGRNEMIWTIKKLIEPKLGTFVKLLNKARDRAKELAKQIAKQITKRNKAVDRRDDYQDQLHRRGKWKHHKPPAGHTPKWLREHIAWENEEIKRLNNGGKDTKEGHYRGFGIKDLDFEYSQITGYASPTSHEQTNLKAIIPTLWHVDDPQGQIQIFRAAGWGTGFTNADDAWGKAESDTLLDQLYTAEGPVTNAWRFKKVPNTQLSATPITALLGDIFTLRNTIDTFGSDFLQTFPTPETPDTTEAPVDTFLQQLQQWASQRLGLAGLEGVQIARFPYGGSFAGGGPVPGPPGAPILITAHGGEEVISREDVMAGPTSHTFEIHGDSRTVAVLEQMIERVNVRSNRGQARSADRRMRLPGNQVR